MDEHARRMCKAGRSGLLAALTAVAILATSLSWPRWAAAENWPAWRGDGSGVEAVPGLLAKTGDKDQFVRRSMLRALGRIAQAAPADAGAIIPALVKGLSDEQSVVKLAAIDAMAGLADKAGGQRQGIVDALKAATADKNAEVVNAAKDALSKSYGSSP